MEKLFFLFKGLRDRLHIFTSNYLLTNYMFISSDEHHLWRQTFFTDKGTLMDIAISIYCSVFVVVCEFFQSLRC